MNSAIRYNWFKIAGMTIVLIPIAMLLLFTLAETIGGDISGLQHLVMAAPLALVALLAWKRPAMGGSILVAVGTLLAALYFFDQHGEATAEALILTELTFFVPAIVAGALLLLAARQDQEHAAT